LSESDIGRIGHLVLAAARGHDLQRDACSSSDTDTANGICRLTMPHGAATIRYQGKRGAVWRIKYRDAAGTQIQETLGREPQWNERRARQELGKRLANIEAGFRKPRRITFASFAARFRDEYLPGRKLKRTTLENYDYILNAHLLPFFGELALNTIDEQPELIDRYIALKAKRLAPKTIHNHLLLLNVIFRRAAIWRLMRSNPIESVDRPRLQNLEMNVLTELEVQQLRHAFDELALAARERERFWWLLANTLVLVALGTGLRRGELLGLRWRDVDLTEATVTVRSAYVRGEFTTPKSRASRRVLEIGTRTLNALDQHRLRSAFRSADDLVFAHPEKGTPLDPAKLARKYLRPALAHAGITKPFRPFHDLRHTSLTHVAAAGNPQIYVQARAGHSQAAITERYMHAAQVAFPGAAERSEDRIFGLPSAPELAAGLARSAARRS
jgi:integrase